MYIHELIDRFCTHESLKGNRRRTVSRKRDILTNFIDHIREQGIFYGQVTEDSLREYLLEHLLKENSECMFNERLRFIRQFYDFLIREQEALVNPCSSIDYFKREKKESPFFTEDEIRLILDSIPGDARGRRDRAIIELFYSTGLRLNELANLALDDVDFREREIHVRYGKGGTERVVPVGEKALESLSRYLDDRYRFFDREREALFCTHDGYRLRKESICSLFLRRKKAAGIEKPGNVHALRHSCATHLLHHGAPIPLIMRILGHAGLSGTQVYTHVSADDLREVVS